MWNCAVDWNNFMLDHSDWANPTLLSIMATSIKGAIEKIKSNGYLHCPESCSTKDNGFIDCQCTSLFPGVKEVKDVDKLRTMQFMLFLLIGGEICMSDPIRLTNLFRTVRCLED